MQRGDLKIDALCAVAGVCLDLVEGLLHTLDNGRGLGLPANQLADHADGGIGTLDVLRVAHDDADAGGLQLLHLLVGLGHGAHEQHLRLERDDLLDVRVVAGLDGGNVQDLRRIVAVFAAADQQIARAQRVEDLTVGGRQRDDALCGRVQRDLAAGHVGQGNGGGGVLCFRLFRGSRVFFGRGGLCFRSRLGLCRLNRSGLCLGGAAGQHGQQHHRCQQQGKKLILFHNSISLFVIKRLPAAFVRMEGSIFYLQTRDLSSFRASRPVSANASGGPIFSALPETMGKKRGAGLRLVHPAGAVHASTRFIVAASTHTHPTGAMVRAACYGTPNLQAAAIQYLR